MSWSSTSPPIHNAMMWYIIYIHIVTLSNGNLITTRTLSLITIIVSSIYTHYTTPHQQFIKPIMITIIITTIEWSIFVNLYIVTHIFTNKHQRYMWRQRNDLVRLRINWSVGRNYIMPWWRSDVKVHHSYLNVVIKFWIIMRFQN